MFRTLLLSSSLWLFGSSAAQNGPVFHWTLDEASGNVAHSVSGTADGVLHGANWDPTVGHHQGSCRFDGVDDRILLGPCDLTNGAGAISLSAWVKPDFVTGMERTVIAKTIGNQTGDHIWSLSFVNASALRFRLRTAGTVKELTTPTSSIFSGTWYHVVASYDGMSMRIFLNGALMADLSTSGSIGFHPQSPASIGALPTGERPISAWIDDVRIYDRGLAQAEVITILLQPELITGTRMPPMIDPDHGLFRPPAGPWTEMHIRDAAGRSITTRRIKGPNDALDLGDMPAGLYLICLSGEGHRAAWPMVIP